MDNALLYRHSRLHRHPRFYRHPRESGDPVLLRAAPAGTTTSEVSALLLAGSTPLRVLEAICNSLESGNTGTLIPANE